MLISSVVLYLRKGRFTATIVGDTRGKTIRLKEMDNLCGCCEWDIQTALNTSGGRVFQFIIVKWPLLRILGITWMAQGRTAQRNNRKGVCWIRWSVLSVIIDSCFKTSPWLFGTFMSKSSRRPHWGWSLASFIILIDEIGTFSQHFLWLSRPVHVGGELWCELSQHPCHLTGESVCFRNNVLATLFLVI